MNARYCEPISIKEARDFLRLEISERAQIPNGSRCLWVAGVRFVNDQPGCYLIQGIGGLQGVIVVTEVEKGEAA